jgi:hypothetical protein
MLKLITHVLRTLAITAGLLGMLWLASTVPLLILFFWACLYYGHYVLGQEVLQHKITGTWPMPHDLFDVPGPVYIVDGPLDLVPAFDLTYTLITAAVLLVIGTALGRSLRYGIGLLVLLLPFICLSDWDYHVGLKHRYPGGKDAYWRDHYRQMCDRTANGNIALDRNGHSICTIVMTNTPPF